MPHRKHPPAPRTPAARMAAFALAALLPGASPAQDPDAALGLPVFTPLPEALLLPIKIDHGPGATGGWVLIYRNGLSRPDAPDRQTETRTVTAPGPAGEPVATTILWQITRTPNDRCPNHAARGCPDRLRILAVPDGFVAVPKSAIVEEHAVQKVFIVPRGMS